MHFEYSLLWRIMFTGSDIEMRCEKTGENETMLR